MDERTIHEIKKLLETISSVITSEYCPSLKPIRQDLETVCTTITSSTRQLADNQQLIYKAMQDNMTELSSQNQILRLQLNLAIAQNRLLIEAINQHLPGSAGLEAARKAVDEIAAATQQPQPSSISDPFL